VEELSYYRPRTAQQAVGLLDGRAGKAELIAGGGDLLPLMAEGIARPGKLISLRDLPDEFRAIEATPAPGLRIGAGVSLTNLAASPVVLRQAPTLAAAAEAIGGPQVRNAATVGGNLCQRTHCPYFRDAPVSCLLKGGDQCYAIDGDNRRHAIFTRGHRCVMVHPSTLAPVLIALGAKATVLGPKGERTIDLAEFYQSPSGPRQREHVLAPDELLLAVTLATPAGRVSGVSSIRSAGEDWPLVEAAVAWEAVGGKVTKARVVLGQVAPTPRLSEAAAEALEGKPVTAEVAAAAGEAAVKGAVPLAGNGYKVKLLAVAVRRAVLAAHARMKAEG
jgi:xanthine dehydrogenase YagS FAD-binding subunit